MNATPVGMYPHADQVAACWREELNCEHGDGSDLPAAANATSADCGGTKESATVSGVEMFLAQGFAQWELWMGKRRPQKRRCASAVMAKLRAEETSRGHRKLYDRRRRRARLQVLVDNCSAGCSIRNPAFEFNSEPITETDYGPMIQPTFAEFSRLAKQGNLIPVYDVFSADLLTPVSAYLRIAQGARYSFLLESVEGGEKSRATRSPGAHPEEVFRYANGACVLESRGSRDLGRERSGFVSARAD